MPQEHQIKLDKLAKQIDALSDALAHLGNTEDLKHLLLIIRRPGYTTPAELAFTFGIVESLNAQVHATAQLKGILVKASELVAAK